MVLTGRRALFPFSLVLAAVVAALAWRNGDTGLAVFAMLLLPAFGAWLAFARTETAIIGTSESDERQQRISAEAVGYAYQAVLVVSVMGFFTEVAHGDPGAFTLVCAVGGFTHLSAVALLRRRR